MFASFDKAFNKKKSIDKIPEPIIKALSTKLPSGFKYVQIDNETCGLFPENDEMKFSLDFIKDNEFKAKTPEELMEYLYRTQKQLEVKSSTIRINGEDFNISDLVKHPLKDIHIDENHSKLIIKPQAFPQPFEIPIGYENGKYINVKIQRQPYADLKKSLFKSIDMESMEISYIIDEINHSMSMDFKIRLDKAKSVEEIIIVSKMYNSFKNGKVIIGNSLINGNVKIKDIDDNFLHLIDFWEKVNKLSEFFKILFEPKDIILEEDVEIIDALYNSFIDNIDFEQFIDTRKFTLTFKNKIETNEIDCINEMIMQFVEYKEYLILERTIKLYCVTTLSNFKIQQILEDETEPFKYEIEVNTLSDKGVLKKMRFFNDEAAVNLYRKKMNNN